MQPEPERLTMAAFVHPQAFWRASPEPGCATQTGQHRGLVRRSAREPDKETGQSGCGGRVPRFPRHAEPGVSVGRQGKLPGMVGGQGKDMSSQGSEAGWPVRAWGAGALGANIRWVSGESERPACEDRGFSLDGTGSQGVIHTWRVTVKFVSVLRGSVCDDETSAAQRVPRTLAQTQ